MPSNNNGDNESLSGYLSTSKLYDTAVEGFDHEKVEIVERDEENGLDTREKRSWHLECPAVTPVRDAVERGNSVILGRER